VAKAAPDGYTFLIHHNGMATAPALYRKLAYNPLTNFEYVGQVVDVPMTLLGRKDLPPSTPQEMMAYLKANAAKLTLAPAGLGAVSQLCGMLFQKTLGAELTTIPCQGTAPALNALLGGQVDILCDQTTQTL
jgi:tripartite-type tricarboxylate transporter receptor subunit TctC